MKFSAFGNKFSASSGIVELMDDLGSALDENPEMIFMGGGNPACIPAVEAQFQARLKAVAADPNGCRDLLGVYQAPQGQQQFLHEVAGYLGKTCGWPVSAKNIAVSNGSQSAFFILFNLLAGAGGDGKHRKIHLPVVPEYVGYADTGLSAGLFKASRPEIERLDENLFKYRVDFSSLKLDSSSAAVCVSRPTNPTGNVLTIDELSQLSELARAEDIPLILDGAYGQPFPDIQYESAQPYWDDNTILVLSLSKLGLPGVRTGIIIGPEPLIEAYTNANTIVSLACGNLGPALMSSLMLSGDLDRLTQQVIRPFYVQRMQQTVALVHQHLEGLPYRLHKPEGAFFLWLWLEGLPGGSQVLYERLKSQGVLVVPGQNFFMGLDEPWAHTGECIRLSYAGDPAEIEKGIQIIAREIKAVWQ